MSTDKKHAPDSLKYQWRLLGDVLRSDWATGLDKTVAYEVIDNYRKDHGNSRASLRYLERATGAARQNVIVSLRRICENGPFSVARKGAGVRPTEYNLHFDRVTENASGHADDTAGSPVPSGHADNTTSGRADSTTNGASGHADSTESVLQVDGLQAGLLVGMVDPAAPTAPPLADGLTAPAAGGTAVEVNPTFELCYRTYAYLKGKKEAKAAWDALPAEVDRAAVIRAAAAWQASWAAQGKPDAPRFTLARWLRDERYDEDAPKGFVKVERAKPAKPATPGKASSAKPTKSPGRITARVTSADVMTSGDVTELRIVATDADGHEHERVIPLEHYDAETQFEGQRRFASLVYAAGLQQVSDSPEFLGRTVIITEDGFVAPTTRPDDEPPLPVKPEPMPYANRIPVKAEESPAAFAARMAATLDDKAWPEWMDSEYEEDDPA